MVQTEFVLDESLVKFLENYEDYGFSDQSEIVCVALERLKDEIQLEKIVPDNTDLEMPENHR